MKLEDMNDKLMMQEIFLSLKTLSLCAERIARTLEKLAHRPYTDLNGNKCVDIDPALAASMTDQTES